MTLNETSTTASTSNPKPSKKELLVHELKEIFAIMIYLWLSLSLLATFRSLVLVQQGINDFAHGYQVAALLALGAAKVVVLVQNTQVMKVWDHRPLIWSVLYRTILMGLIVEGALRIEEHLFNHHKAAPLAAVHPIALIAAHQAVVFSIFAVLFFVRGLSRELGPGKLANLILKAPAQADVQTDA